MPPVRTRPFVQDAPTGEPSRMKDVLYLLSPGFFDPAFPDGTFYCWHCALIEGVLASFPQHGAGLDVRRIAWARPRQDVVSILGEENQSLPLLVLPAGDSSAHQIGTHGGRAFVTGKDSILAALSERHGFPAPHS